MAAESLTDPRILAVADTVTIEEDPDLTGRFPEQCLASVTLRLKDGREIKSRILSAKGDPDNPYSDEELMEKFLHLTRNLPEKLVQTLLPLILEVPQSRPSELWRLLSGPV